MPASQPTPPVLPSFTLEGLLPVGDYPFTIDELRSSHLVTGAGNPSEHWDKNWRLYLVDNLEILLMQLRSVPSIGRIFVDGSFVEDKDHPNDIDGYFECDLKTFVSGELERQLNALDPFKCWTWNPAERRPYRNSVKLQLPMWHRYRVELYPHYGQPSGIRDKYGNMLKFPAAFRKSRTEDRPKGIIEIVS